MNDGEKQISKKSLLIIILSLVIVIITGNFAWLTWRTQETAMVLVVGNHKGLQVTLTPYQINATLSPVSSYTDGIVVNVTANNQKTTVDDFKLFYQIDTIDSALIDIGFKYTITRCIASCDTDSNYQILSNAEGNFANASSGNELFIYQESIPASTTYKYRVYLWIDSSAGNQSNMQNKTFKGELRAKISQNIYSMMKDNAVIDNATSTYVTGTNGINWNALSSDTNGKGIYLRAGTEYDTYPIYYYRGEVTNNNVKFAGFCWKIVRTTSTGGTKLIYNGTPAINTGACNNTGTDSQLAATSKFNSNYNSPADAGYMYGTRYANLSKPMTSLTDVYMYATGYDETNHRLIATDAINFAGTDWATYYNQLNNNHYTCFNTSGECNQVYYIYYTSDSTAYYVEIPSGKTLSSMLDEMLTSSSNTNDSTIKEAIDNWYATNMTSYESKLEDTPYCNDRTIYQLNGWSPTGSITSYLYFGAYGRTNSPYTPNLTCNTNDAFTKSSSIGNGKLIYPVGLLTADETRLAGGSLNSSNTLYYLYTGQVLWTMTPHQFFINNVQGFVIATSGTIGKIAANVARGVRPVVSLKPGTMFSDGDGSAINPYIVVNDNVVYTASTLNDVYVIVNYDIPNTVAKYYTPNEAMAALRNAGGNTKDYPFYLKHVVEGNKSKANYVEFIITSTMANNNSGLTAGTYSLRGGDGGASYQANKRTLLAAFGSSYCTDYGTSYQCNVSGLGANAFDDGRAYADDTSGMGCTVNADSASRCYTF